MRPVLKLGGHSVRDAERIEQSTRHIQRLLESGYKPLLVVVSARKGETDRLIHIAEEVAQGADMKGLIDSIAGENEAASTQLGVSTDYLGEYKRHLEDGLEPIARGRTLHQELLDQVVCNGEFASVERLNLYLNKGGINSVAKHPWDLETVCNGNFGNAEIDPMYRLQIKRNIALERADVIVTDGYYYITKNGKKATIGRGGSDKSAVDYAVVIGSRLVMIGGDTNGVMTADPKIVPDAVTVSSLSYEEAKACSAHGAKILHPRALKPITDNSLNIPVKIFNTLKEDGLESREKYTVIGPDAEIDSGHPIKVINCLKIPWVLTVKTDSMYGRQGFNLGYYKILNDNGADTLFNPDSYNKNTSLIINEDIHTATIQKDLETLIRDFGGKIEDDTIVFDDCYSLVTVVGEGIRTVPGITGIIGSVLGEYHIKIVSHSASKEQICMPYLLHKDHAYDAVNRLHEKLFRSGK